MSDGDSRRTAARPRLDVEVVHARDLRAAGLAPWLRRVAPARARGVVTVALVPDARVRALNRQYRGKDAPTDVLSFPGDQGRLEGRPLGGRPRPLGKADVEAGLQVGLRHDPSHHLGDVVIASGVARRQAREAGHSVQTELRILALHGLLHLLGYDHETDDGRMARVERRLRRQGGLREGLIERGHAPFSRAESRG